MTSSKIADQAETMKFFGSISVSSTSAAVVGPRDCKATKENDGQIKTKKRKFNRSSAAGSIKTMLWNFLWSSRRNFVLNAILCDITLLCFLSLLISDEVNCDDDLMQYQRPDLFESSQMIDSDNSRQREARQFNLGDLFGSQNQQQQESSSAVQYNQIEGPSSSKEMSHVSSMLNRFNQAQRQNFAESEHSDAEDLLETAQTKAQSNSIATSESNEKSASGGTSAADGTQSSATSSTSSSSSSSTASSSSPSPLSEQLSAVSNLIQQAGQLGLSAAQQNVALSEAIINGVTNTLIRNNNQNRKQSTPGPRVQASAVSRPGGVVGQSIDGNIEYDSNQNAINGFIEFPNFNFSSFTNARPSINSAFKPFLVAALKTVPIKLGTVGWKLLQLLAWKKIYKAHHPKSGEIIIEQEMGKHSSHGLSDIKGGKLSGKVGDHLTGLGNKLKTSKMGQSYSGDDWMSMMRSPGAGIHGGDMFSSGGWPQAASDSPSASASMLFQRHLLPPGLAVAAGQPAAAAAAAAAATAAAIQSHWFHQQQQQQPNMLSDEVASTAGESQQTRLNQTNAHSGSAADALRRKKASYGGGNWYAATPAQAYVAAAAAANAAASLASQQHHHQQQRLAHMMRAYELGGNLDQMQMVATGTNVYGGPGHGFIYPNLFDNQASMAVQNAVKLPPTESHNPLATAEFLDQSDSTSGSSFGSPFSSMGGSLNDFNERM